MNKSLNILLFILFALSCEDSSNIDTYKNTYYDDIADITYLNESFYTTNNDFSGLEAVMAPKSFTILNL